jgi:carbamoyl-phosphate synthase large subunit
MGLSDSFGMAFAKAQLAAGNPLPLEGRVFVSVNDFDKKALVPVAKGLAEMGFELVATAGTCDFLTEHGIPAQRVFKAGEGRPNIIDRMVSGEIQLIVNTPLGRESYFDEPAIRKTATMKGVPLVTTMSGAAAAVQGIRALREKGITVMSLQELHA